MTDIKTIEDYGFKRNHKIICGFIPHYTRNEAEVLFLIGADFWCSKIVAIAQAYKWTHCVYGLLTPKAPAAADKDWVTGRPVLYLIKLNPLMAGQWKPDGSDIEYIKTSGL